MVILGVDSSAKSASVAVVQDGAILGEFFVNHGLTHSQTLLPMIEHLLEVLDMQPSQLDVLAVNNGPGSFTGIRIGVACVKGIGFAGGQKCVGVSTLLSLAHNIGPYDGIICPVMDARCQQVYNALFTWQEGKLVRLCEDRAISVEALKQEIISTGKNVILVGDGASLCYNMISEEVPAVELAREPLRYVRGSSVAMAAVQCMEQAVTAQELTPTYLRPSQAERERVQKQKQQTANEV